MPVKEYTKDVALAAGSESGIQTLSLMPLDRLVPKGAQLLHCPQESDQASESGHGMEAPQRQEQGRERYVVWNG